MRIGLQKNCKNALLDIKKIFVFLLLFCLILADASAVFAESSFAPSDTDSVLAFTSDIHVKAGNVSADRFERFLSAVKDSSGEGRLDFVGICGDLGDGGLAVNNAPAYWTLANTAIQIAEGSGAALRAYTSGIHDQQQGHYGNLDHPAGEIIASEDLTADSYARSHITRLGVPASFNLALQNDTAGNINYRIFCLGTDSSGRNCSDGVQKGYIISDADIAELGKYLRSSDANIPVIILSHYPLHSISSRTVYNSDKLINLLNNFPNVIFLWGHNHTEGAEYINNLRVEDHYDRIYTDSIDGTAINFTYAAAGCMSDFEYDEGSESVKGKGLVIRISNTVYPEIPKISMVYYDAEMNKLFDPVEIDISKKISKYNIKLDLTGGNYQGSSSSIDLVKLRGVKLSLEDYIPERDGYSFAGWECPAKGMYIDAGGDFTFDEDTALKAVWANNNRREEYLKITVRSFLGFVRIVKIDTNCDLHYGPSLSALSSSSRMFMRLFTVEPLYFHIKSDIIDEYYYFDCMRPEALTKLD